MISDAVKRIHIFFYLTLVMFLYTVHYLILHKNGNVVLPSSSVSGVALKITGFGVSEVVVWLDVGV